MFDFINPIKTYGLLIVGIIAAVLLFVKDKKIEDLEADLALKTSILERTKADKENAKMQLDTCINEINKANDEIARIAIDRDEVLNKFNAQKKTSSRS